MSKNPLLAPFETPPFHLIKNEHYKPAFETAISLAKEEISAVKKQSEAPTFENTVAALDYAGQTLGHISSIFFNLNSAETSPEMQQIAQEVSPLLTAFSNDLSLDPELFKRVKAVYKQKDSLSLDTESQRLLDKSYKSFVRNGALLEEAGQSTLREIDKNLSRLQLEFGEHVLADTQIFSIHITDELELDGLPDSVKTAAEDLHKAKIKKAGSSH